jgi:hypothetical protein
LRPFSNRRKSLGLCLVFGDPAGPKGKTIRMTGEARVVLGGTRAYFEAVLLSQGYAIVPLGDAASNLALVEPIDTSKNLKARAPVRSPSTNSTDGATASAA